MSEDEHPVEQYVQGIGGQYDPHGDRGVAYAFEKLLERQEDHQRQNAPSQHVEVRHGQRYHVAYVVRAVLRRQHIAQRPHQRSYQQRRGGGCDADHGAVEHAVLQQMRHASFVASCEVLADYGRDAQRESQRPEINYQKERAAERYCGQRQRILAAEASVSANCVVSCPACARTTGMASVRMRL